MQGTKCRGICDQYKVSVKSYHNNQFKKCIICDVFLDKSHDRCPCCKMKIRCKPKGSKDKRSAEGDQALTLFDITVMRATNEFRMIHKCYKLPELGHNIIEALFRNLHQAISQIEIIKEKKRQRPEYLQAKYEMMHKLIDKIGKEISLFNKKSVYFSRL